MVGGSEMADFTIGYTQQFYQSLVELVSWWEEELLFTEAEISRFVTLIYDSLQKVRHFPQMYPEVSEVYGFTQPTHRIVIGKALALFYRVDEARQVIVVGRIFQTKQLKLQF